MSYFPDYRRNISNIRKNKNKIHCSGERGITLDAGVDVLG